MSLIADIDNLVDKVQDNITIDIDTLDDESERYAQELVKNVTLIFQDEDWMNSHPQATQRIKIELETLRGLIKMRKADEVVHDALLKAISSNNLNASLYKSLSEIQRTSLNVTTKINETIDIINNLMRGFQLDAPSDSSSADGEVDEKTIWRGSKDFIKSMAASK